MSALQAVKNFRIKELTSLKSHVKRFGPVVGAISEGDENDEKSEAELITVARPARTPVIKPKHILPNPFLPRLNPITGRWSPAQYSLRQQADLIKKAKASSTLHLLPPGPKLSDTAIKAAALKVELPTDENGLRVALPTWQKTVGWHGKYEEKTVAGADIGARLYASKKRMFKGHQWERVYKERKRRRAMYLHSMDKRITRFKTYAKKRTNPFKPSKSLKPRKLPF